MTDRIRGFLVVQAIALMIALAMPITPPKTGSKWNAGELISETPTYLHEVVVWFVITNLLVVVLGVVAVLYARVTERRSHSD